MKIILTSNGVSSKKVERKFLNLSGNPEKKKVLVIRTVRKNGHDEYADEILDELKRAGFDENKIRFANPFREFASEDMKNFDIIYSAGGNTFIILNEFRLKGFDSLIKEMIREGKVYLGVSAGTILLQESIEIAEVGKNGDPNYINLKDLSGLGIVDLTVFPHYEDSNESEIKKFEKENKIQVTRLRDEGCIVIKN